MKIVFSPFYDGEIYLDYTQNPITDKIVVGPMGLLSELELRAGLTCTPLSEIERQAMYSLALKKYIARNPRSLFAESVKVDDFGAAAELLRWRDELTQEGWRKEMVGISEKLDALSAIEHDFDCVGLGDRWRRIVERSDLGNFLPSGWELEVHIKKELLAPVYTTIFDNLEKQGAAVSYREEEPRAENGNLKCVQQGLSDQDAELSVQPEDKATLRFLAFRRLNDAYVWIARQNYDPATTVVVNEERKALDNVFYSFGKPRSGSVVSASNPQVAQLFKLGLSLFVKPLNVYNLLSYLQVPVNPLPSDLRFKLTDIIIHTGGLGDEWAQALEEYRFKDADGNDDPKKKKQRYVFLPMITEAGTMGRVEAARLKEYVSALSGWAAGRLNTDSIVAVGIREQLSNIVTFCDAFNILLSDVSGDTITYDQLKSWVMSIYRPANYTHENAQKSSFTTVETPAAIVDSPEKIVWLDCFDKPLPNYPFEFLNKEEVERLRQRGVTIWDKDRIVKTRLWAIKNGLRKATGSIDIILPTENTGDKLSAHPVVIELKQRLGESPFKALIVDESELESMAEPDTIVPLPTCQSEYRLMNLRISPREKESYSSLEKLIQYPFDYALEYFAKLRDKGVKQLQDLERTKGNVAHKMIETLVKDSGQNIRRFVELASEQFDARFQQAMENVGLILLLDENQIEREKFRIKMNEALASLSVIIEGNGLKMEGCEVTVAADFDGMPTIEVRMDLLLTNHLGEYVVFDLKWSESNYYKKKLQANRSMQLEIYKAVLEKRNPDKKVAATGYFLMAKGILVTADDFASRIHIETVEKGDNPDVFTQVRNSCAYRYAQFNEGMTEEGESIDLDTMPYHIDSGAKGLYPLDVEYGTKNNKAPNIFSPYSTLKGHVK